MTKTELETASLNQALKLLPGGDLIIWLETKLEKDDFDKACDYILETILSQLILICEEKTQAELNNFLEKDDFAGFFDILGNLLDPKNPQAPVFQYQIMDSLQLGFEVVVAQHNLDLNS